MTLITEPWLEQNAALHKTDPTYGASGHKIAGLVEYLAGTIGARTALDYGCGKATLSAACPNMIWHNYDPAIPKYEHPKPADIVVCSDVMEHVEADFVPNVLNHIFDLSFTGCALFLINLAPGTRSVPNGALCHCTVRSSDWWLTRLSRYGSPLILPPTGPRRDELVVWIR